MMIIVIKAIGIQILFLAVYFGLLKRYKTFSFNRYFLLCGLLAILTFSWIEVEIPHYVVMPIIETEGIAPTLQSSHSVEAVSYDYSSTIVYGVLGIGLLIFMSRWFSIMRLGKRRLGYSPQGYEVRALRQLASPFSFWPRIYMSVVDYQDSNNELIIRHEEIHLNNLHSFDVVLGELVGASLWFSPLSWMYLKAIKNNHEYEVDHHFAHDSETLNAYIELLYKSWSQTGPLMVSRFDYTTNKNRIVMLTSQCPKLSRLAMFLVVMLASVPLMFMACTEKTVLVPEENVLTEDEPSKSDFIPSDTDIFPDRPVELEFNMPTESQWGSYASHNLDSVRGRSWKDGNYLLCTYMRDSVIVRLPSESEWGDQERLLHMVSEIDRNMNLKLSKFVPSPPPSPPPPKKPSSGLIELWMNDRETYGIWLDGEKIDNSEIDHLYMNDDIYFYSVIDKELQRKINKVSEYENQVNLMSKDAHYDYINYFEVKEKAFLEQLEQWRLKDYIKSIKESLENDDYDALLRPEELIKTLHISDDHK